VNRDLARGGLYAVLTGWFGLTVALHAGGRAARYAGALDPYGTTLPFSKFFAPRPGSTDRHLLVRDELADGTLTDWGELELVVPRTARHTLWHPGRRQEKALMDAVNGLLQAGGADYRQLQLSTPYLSLLNLVVARIPHATDARRVQFMIVTTCGRDTTAEPVVDFRSEFHQL
jgi:hypothetical protein